MATRSNVVLQDKRTGDSQVYYRHWDGYPSMSLPPVKMAAEALGPVVYHSRNWEEVEKAFHKGMNQIAKGWDIIHGTDKVDVNKKTYRREDGLAPDGEWVYRITIQEDGEVKVNIDHHELEFRNDKVLDRDGEDVYDS